MISYIEVTPYFQSLSVRIRELSDELEDPEANSSFSRMETPAFDETLVNVLSKGDVRLQKDGQVLVLLEIGDIVPVLPEEASFSLGVDGAIEIKSYQPSRHLFSILELSRLACLELLACQIAEQHSYVPEMETYLPGEIIFTQGEEGLNFKSLVEGKAQAEVDDTVVGEICSGEAFGIVAPLTNGRRSASVRAVSRCTVLSVPADEIEKMMVQNPQLSINIMKSLANNLLQANKLAAKKSV